MRGFGGGKELNNPFFSFSPSLYNLTSMDTLNIVILIAYELLKIVAIVHVLMDNRQPVKTMAWVMVIYFVPVAGLLLYFFFGVNTRRERMMSERSLNQLTKRAMAECVEPVNVNVPERHKALVELFVRQNMAMPFKDNTIEIISDGTNYFLRLLRDIGAAKSHIHIDLFIFADDALGNLVADALIDSARRGVEVKVIYDYVGSWSVKRRFVERMRDEGIEVCPFLPVRFPLLSRKVNYRNHRKIIVIDGKVGYIGGMNIALRYVKGRNGGTWRDTMARVSGTAVYGLQRAFLVDWYFVDRTLITDRRYYPPIAHIEVNDCVAQVVTSSPVALYPNIMQGYVQLIHSAQRYIYIETPYFLPNEAVLFALRSAVVRGVDVSVIVPRRTDSHVVEWASRSYMRAIVETGANVYLYTPGFLHSKMLVCDDEVVTCGSTNVDFRSFENDFEANLFIYDSDTALRFRRLFEKDRQQSVALAELPLRMSPSLAKRLWESLTRLLSPLF